jgi:hypothetical protein
MREKGRFYFYWEFFVFLMRTIMPTIQSRERKMRALLKVGQATSLDLLKLAFNGELPKGINITKLPTGEVQLRSQFADEKGIIEKLKNLYAAGYRRDKSIFINSLLDKLYNMATLGLTQQTSSTVVHEHAHVLQGGSGKVGDLLDPDSPMYKLHVMADQFFGHENLRSPPLTLLGKAKKQVGRGINTLIGSSRDSEDGTTIGYRRKGPEIQARLHELLSDGYPEWGKLPVTRHELWAALANRGMSPPPEICKELATSPEGRAAVATFGSYRKYRSITNKASAELNSVAHSIGTLKGQENFWRQLLPKVCRNLITLYGDESGQKRMRGRPEEKKKRKNLRPSL